MSTAARLHESLSAVCPIVTVRVTGAQATFVPAPSATPQQVAAASAALAAFDWSEAATAAWELDQRPARKAVVQAAQQAITSIDAYLALPSPTAGQVKQAVDGLATILRKIIPYLLTLD